MPKLRTKLTTCQVERAHVIVTTWMHQHYGITDPTSDSRQFYTPMLQSDFDFGMTPCPALVLELGDDWAIYAAGQCRDDLKAIGVFAEPYSGWALCLYVP